MSTILFKEESYIIIGICMEIHRTLGMGLKEVNYKDAMEIEFIQKQVKFERERKFEVFYKNQKLKNPYYADFVVDESIILEVKSCTTLVDAHVAQTLSYLSVAKKRLALLINFGERSLTHKRILL